jgi:hypothetical protein
MAPTAKPKVVPEGKINSLRQKSACQTNNILKGCVASADYKKLQCLICTANSGKEFWMDWRTYAATHLSSKTHERAVERDAVRKKQIVDTQRTQEADLARQHAAELQFLALREVQIPQNHQTTHCIQSTAETELWDGINADPYGAGFNVGQKSPQHGTLPDLWNAEAMGTDARFALDMDGGPTAIDEDDTEEFLAEIMQNAGEQIELCTRNDPVTF